MNVWILEHAGGSYDDHFSEILGIFDTLEKAKASFPSFVWDADKYGRDILEFVYDKHYPGAVYIYSMELNKLYPADYALPFENKLP